MCGQDPTAGFAGDGGPATQALLNFPGGLAFDKAGNLYIADTNNNRIRRVDLNGVISTYAGTGRSTGTETTGLFHHIVNSNCC